MHFSSDAEVSTPVDSGRHDIGEAMVLAMNPA
jgi:hypothetical protein